MGIGKEEENLLLYINNKNLQNKIEVFDFVPDIHNKIINSKMFVSTSNYEGISNSMIEAMGMGIPVIVTDCPCGGARMMVRNNENGILVKVGDTEAVAHAMEQIATNQEMARNISKKALQIREKLKKEKICEEWVKLI